MGADDDGDCVEHQWKLAGVHLGDGADVDYECTRCDAVLLVPAGRPLPGSV